jgi:ribosomal protein L3
MGFEEVKKEKRVDRPTKGIYKKAGLNPCRIMKEFPMGDLKVGESITADKFQKGDFVTVTGISKARASGCYERGIIMQAVRHHMAPRFTGHRAQ